MVMTVNCIFTTKEGNCKAWDLVPCIFSDPRVKQSIGICRLAKEDIAPKVWKEGRGLVEKEKLPWDDPNGGEAPW